MKGIIFAFIGLILLVAAGSAASAAAPSITQIERMPLIVYTDTNWAINMTAVDQQYDVMTGYVQFYINDAAFGSANSVPLLNNTNTLVATLSSANFVKNDVLRAEYWAANPDEETAKQNISTIVQNSPPEISEATLTIESHETSASRAIIATDKDGDTLQFTVVSNNPEMVTCTISGNNIVATRVEDDKTGTATCTVTANDGTATASADYTIDVRRKSMLSIYRLDVFVDDVRESNMKDGDRIRERVKPGSELRFDFTIENLFDRDDRIDIDDVRIRVTIRDIDDRYDLEEESRSFDIDAGRRSSVQSLEFRVPLDVRTGEYDIEIVVDGEESRSPYHEHRIEWSLSLRVDKERDDVRLDRSDLSRTTVSCDRNINYFVSLVNYGRDDQRDIILEVENQQLGIKITEENIRIDEGRSWSRTLPIRISDTASPGTYRFTTKMFYDRTDYIRNDFDLNAYAVFDIVVQECVPPTPPTPPDDDDDDEVVIIKPPVDETPPPADTITREISFQDTGLYLVLLVATVIILAGIFLAVVFKVLSK